MATATKLARRLPLVVILGVTGSGKSKLALELAQKFQGEIISADSMQVYQGLDIVTNKVTADERRQVPHHMLDYLSPLTHTSVSQFTAHALPIIENIFDRGRMPIIVGGTNYYIEALLWKTLLDKPVTTNDPERNEEDTASSERYDERDTRRTTDVITGPERYDVSDSKPATDIITDETVSVARESCDDVTTRHDFRTWSAEKLYEKLKSVDPESARRIHPNDRRKLARAVEVYEDHGRPMSDLLADQHRAAGAGELHGPLRYPDPCVLWVQCDRQALCERTDRRVDQMITQGLVEELTQFHRQYNEQRISQHKEADYSQGIFQCIGFKEFHEYLVLSEAEQQSTVGQALLTQATEQMKLVTRRYARKQLLWIRNRFLKRRGHNVPRLYGVDSSLPEEWADKVRRPAEAIVSAFIQGEEPSQSSVPLLSPDYEPQYNECSTCGQVFVTAKEWQIHIKSKKHKVSLQRKRKQHVRLCRLLDNRQRQLEDRQPDQDPTSCEVSQTEHRQRPESCEVSQTEHRQRPESCEVSQTEHRQRPESCEVSQTEQRQCPESCEVSQTEHRQRPESCEVSQTEHRQRPESCEVSQTEHRQLPK